MKLEWGQVRVLPFHKIDIIQKANMAKYHIVENEEHWEKVRNRQTLIGEKSLYFNGTFAGGLAANEGLLISILHDIAISIDAGLMIHCDRYTHEVRIIYNNEFNSIVKSEASTLIEALYRLYSGIILPDNYVWKGGKI